MAANKRVGKKSLAQNDNLFPAAPLIGTATDVGTGRAYNDGAATVTFTAQGPNAATSYTVTSSPGGYTASGASSPITVQGLQSATNYTFTVTATNAYGTSASSASTSAITATTVPAAPGTPTVSSVGVNNAQPQGTSPATDTVSWTAPANGGKAISLYYWSSSDGKSGSTANTSVAVTQESNTSQTWSVYAVNANGNSATSTSGLSTSAFSFVPFGAFGFSPFGFSPFGFSPFSFSPYGAPAFWCIAENTEIATITDEKLVMVKAKDLALGTKVLSPTWAEFNNTEIDNPYESRVEYETLTEKKIADGFVSKISKKTVDKSIILNGDSGKHYSLTQPILARKVGKLDAWEKTGDLEVGDIIWEYDFDTNQFKETVLSEILVKLGDQDVYTIGIDGVDTFLAGGIISHNK